METYSLYITI